MKYSLALLFIALISFSSCKETESKAITTEKIAFTKEGELRIHKNDSLLVSLDIEFAETEYEVQTGLMYRDQMKEKQGMLFIFPDVRVHSFYMKNTEIPLDIIFIDENLTIASFQENAKPFDETGLSSLVPIQYVLEVNAGLAEKWNLEVGDKISYNR